MVTKSKIDAFYDLLHKQIISIEEYDSIISLLIDPERTKKLVAQNELEKLIKILGEYYQVDPKRIISRERTPEIIKIRQLGMYLAKEMIGMSVKEIGVEFGGCDHFSTSFAIEKTAARIKEDPKAEKDVERIRNAYLYREEEKAIYAKEKLVENGRDDHDKVFMAYSRKLLRELEEIRLLIRTGNVTKGENLLDEIIFDTKLDTEPDDMPRCVKKVQLL
ncbi:hypothetical protein DXB23_01565 [Dorea sp. OM02-2LB]|nr:hypothetical protein DXB23_01565 [Dorea sp. OM02-2LB]